MEKGMKRMAVYEGFLGAIMLIIGFYLGVKAAAGTPIVMINAKGLLSYAFFVGVRFLKAKYLYIYKKLHYVVFFEYIELLTFLFIAVLTVIFLIKSFEIKLLITLGILVLAIFVKMLKTVLYASYYTRMCE